MADWGQHPSPKKGGGWEAWSLPTGQETGRLSEQAWAGRRIAPGAGGPWIAASRGPAELGKHAHPFNPPQAPRRALGRALPPAEPGDKAIRKKGPVHPPRCRLRAAGGLCAHTQPLVTWGLPPKGSRVRGPVCPECYGAGLDRQHSVGGVQNNAFPDMCWE